LFDSNGEYMFDDPEFFDTYVEKIPIGMKRKYVFYELPYLEDLKIGHLLDTMHILKSVSTSLQRHISWNKVTNWLLGEILLLQILKRDIGQETKLKERLVPLGLLKKVMSHGF
jgi:hypothetical protein